MISKLQDIVKEIFPGVEIDFENQDLGIGSFPQWDSLANFNLLLKVEESFGLQFTPEELVGLNKFALILDLLKSKNIAGE